MRRLGPALLLAALGACQAGGNAGLGVTTLYFDHAGESDRPLMPFVLTAARPSEDEMAQVLGEVLWRSAAVFDLPPPDLAWILAQVEDLGAAGEGERPDYGFGAYTVTVVTPSARRSVHLAPQRAVRLFRSVAERIGSESPKLREYLAALADLIDRGAGGRGSAAG